MYNKDSYKKWYFKNKTSLLIKLKNKRNNPIYKKKQSEYYKQWYKKNGRVRDLLFREIIYKWRENNPLAVSAYKILHKEIRNNKLIIPINCVICKQKKRLSAHHEDYNKPLDVKWLCSSCHKKIHIKYSKPVDYL